MSASPPPQSAPVARPALVEPHRVVEVQRGSRHELLRARMYLLHGANYNDPAAYAWPDFARMSASAILPGSGRHRAVT